MANEVLTDEETIELMKALIDGTAPLPTEEETMERFYDWARGVRIDEALLNLALTGKVIVRWNHDEQQWSWKKRG